MAAPSPPCGPPKPCILPPSPRGLPRRDAGGATRWRPLTPPYPLTWEARLPCTTCGDARAPPPAVPAARPRVPARAAGAAPRPALAVGEITPASSSPIGVKGTKGPLDSARRPSATLAPPSKLIDRPPTRPKLVEQRAAASGASPSKVGVHAASEAGQAAPPVTTALPILGVIKKGCTTLAKPTPPPERPDPAAASTHVASLRGGTKA